MKKIVVVGGPISQNLDPVLRVVPSGSGHLAEAVAAELEKDFHVQRLGSFPNGKTCDFDELRDALACLTGIDAVVFLAHLPNVRFGYSKEKIRAGLDEAGCVGYRGAEKLVSVIKKTMPETLLVPFKLADSETTRVEIVRWMLQLSAGFAVYSWLGDSHNFSIIDVFGNETFLMKDNLPSALAARIKHHLSAIRRRSEILGYWPVVAPFINVFRDFVTRSSGAFSQLSERNVESGRWPGNFSSRAEDDSCFLMTRRNVDKAGLSEKDFALVEFELRPSGRLGFWGSADMKPSVDAPVHRIIYRALPWVEHIVHAHKELSYSLDFVHPAPLTVWPCGAENEGHEIVASAPRSAPAHLWVANMPGHGFIAFISETDPAPALEILAVHLR